jgi:protein TonB
MMALRNSPNETALVHALEGRPRRRSRALVVAVGASVAFHLGLLAYLYIERFNPAAPTQASDRQTTIDLWRLPTAAPKPKPQPHTERPVVSHIPPLLPTTPSAPRPIPVTPQPLTAQTNVAGFTPNFGELTPEHPASRLIVDPRWLSQPTAEEMSRLYPQTAIDRDLTGDVSLMCAVVATGKLTDCKVMRETPAGAGFGQAAVKLSAYFRMTP